MKGYDFGLLGYSRQFRTLNLLLIYVICNHNVLFLQKPSISRSQISFRIHELSNLKPKWRWFFFNQISKTPRKAILDLALHFIPMRLAREVWRVLIQDDLSAVMCLEDPKIPLSVLSSFFLTGSSMFPLSLGTWGGLFKEPFGMVVFSVYPTIPTILVWRDREILERRTATKRGLLRSFMGIFERERKKTLALKPWKSRVFNQWKSLYFERWSHQQQLKAEIHGLDWQYLQSTCFLGSNNTTNTGSLGKIGSVCGVEKDPPVMRCVCFCAEIMIHNHVRPFKLGERHPSIKWATLLVSQSSQGEWCRGVRGINRLTAFKLCVCTVRSGARAEAKQQRDRGKARVIYFKAQPRRLDPLNGTDA